VNIPIDLFMPKVSVITVIINLGETRCALSALTSTRKSIAEKGALLAIKNGKITDGKIRF
jgi:hypothetical protein